MLRAAVFAFLALAAAPAAALEFERCTKSQIGFAGAAVEGAREVILRASARVGDTPEFERWFGPFNAGRAEQVRSNLKAVDRLLAGNELTVICPHTGVGGCDPGTFAYVMLDEHARVNVCASFFRQPTMAGMVAGGTGFETGSREGTIIHEVSHFPRVAGTDDHCYTRSDCSDMAGRSPRQAIDNADSYQYFAEDVMLAWREEQRRLGASARQ